MFVCVHFSLLRFSLTGTMMEDASGGRPPTDPPESFYSLPPDNNAVVAGTQPLFTTLDQLPWCVNLTSDHLNEFVKKHYITLELYMQALDYLFSCSSSMPHSSRILS